MGREVNLGSVSRGRGSARERLLRDRPFTFCGGVGAYVWLAREFRDPRCTSGVHTSRVGFSEGCVVTAWCSCRSDCSGLRSPCGSMRVSAEKVRVRRVRLSDRGRFATSAPTADFDLPTRRGGLEESFCSSSGRSRQRHRRQSFRGLPVLGHAGAMAGAPSARIQCLPATSSAVRAVGNSDASDAVICAPHQEVAAPSAEDLPLLHSGADRRSDRLR
jgi:hypothetical protein